MNGSSSYTMAGNIVSLLFWVLVCGIIVYNLFIKKAKNRTAAASGEDLRRVEQAVRGLLPQDDQNAGIVYAHWEDVTHSGRTTRTTYYRYAAAFKGETLWVFPLQVDKKTHDVQAGSPWVLTPGKLGKVMVTISDKNGMIRQLEVWLADKQGDVIVKLYVNAENLNSSKFLPMNILQEDECAAFERFISPLAQKVAADNPGIDEMIAQKSAGGKAGVAIGLAVGGLLGGIFVPPVGLFLCVVALALSIRAKKWSGGRNGMASLIVSVICLLLSAAWCAFFLWMSFSTL